MQLFTNDCFRSYVHIFSVMYGPNHGKVTTLPLPEPQSLWGNTGTVVVFPRDGWNLKQKGNSKRIFLFQWDWRFNLWSGVLLFDPKCRNMWPNDKKSLVSGHFALIQDSRICEYKKNEFRKFETMMSINIFSLVYLLYLVVVFLQMKLYSFKAEIRVN